MKQCLVLTIVLLLLVVSLFGIEVDQRTENIRIKRKQKEYHLYPTRVNWTEAMKNCESRGMELVSILSKMENDNVISSIKEAGHGHIGFWTSGNRLGKGDVYYWSNRTQVTFTDWENGKPDKRIIDDEEEECIEMKGFNIFKWNDNFCSHEMYYICETS